MSQQTNTSLQHLFRCQKVLPSLWILSLLSSGGYAFSAEKELNINKEFTRTVYAGAGLGISVLEPNTNKIDGFLVDDRISRGGQINLGLDLFKQLSVELHSTDLGNAELSPAGQVSYYMNGISALVYAGGNHNYSKRSGLSAYGRGGFGQLRNSLESGGSSRKTNSNNWLWGAGVEYMHRNGLGARAELISFSEDAKYGQLGMIYRFGENRHLTTPEKQSLPETSDNALKPAIATPPPPPAPPPPPPPPPPVEKPPTAQKTAEDHCNDLKGVLDGIRFDTGSARLSSAAQSVLDNVAVTLSKCPQVPVIISAHTDSQGSERINQILSQRRAWAVINYLRGIDIDLYRLIPRAFGEAMPIDSNDTPEGRRNNRRVEVIGRQ